MQLEKDAFYFPHFCNARHDRKIKRVRKELGLEGYGIFFMLLETLREQADYSYPVDDIDLLADEFGTSEQKLRCVISNYDLFQVTDNNRFFSSNLIMYLQPYFEGKEKKRISGIKGNLIKHGYYTSEELKGKCPDDILLLANEIKGFSHCDHVATTPRPQILANKTKLNQSKQSKENKTNAGSEESKHMDFEPFIDTIDSLIAYWNSKGNLPHAPISVNMKSPGRTANQIADYESSNPGYIRKAIDNLSKYRDSVEPKYRTSKIDSMIENSVGYWAEYRPEEEKPDSYNTDMNFDF